MRKSTITLVVVVVGLAVPAASNAAAKWPRNLACTATTTALTCTGKVGGLRPYIYPIGPSEAAISGEVHYACTDPVFQFIFYGSPTFAPPSVRYLAGIDLHNGKTFSIEFSPGVAPRTGLFDPCFLGEWTRDPNYYNVRVVAGWGFGSATPIEAVEAAIGTVSAE
jgi:hypothetical protein